MRRQNMIRLIIAGFALTAFGGCAPMIVSHRFHPDCTGPISVAQMHDGELSPCHCGSILDHFVYFAGRHHPLLPGADPDGSGMGTTHPPISRFHPVPTRPVFAPRDAVVSPHVILEEPATLPVPPPAPAEEPQLLPTPMKTAANAISPTADELTLR